MRVTFPARAQALAPYVREGLRFGLRHSVLVLDSGALKPGSPIRPVREAGELRDLLASAALVGRWLARIQTPATTMAFLGIRP